MSTPTPVDPTAVQATSLAGIDELVAQARRLGLLWGLRPGIVVDTSSGGGPYNPRVRLDGDDANTTIITTLLGTLAPAVGMRVMVMSVPPNGNYVVGIISTANTQRFEIGALSNHGTSITTTETVLETFSQFAALGGAAYKIEIDGFLIAATTTFTTFRLRKTNTAGQSLNASDQTPGIGLGNAPFRHVGYFRNTGNGTVLANLVLTAVTATSSSTWGGDAERPRYVSIQYVGPAVEYPSAVVIT